MRAVAVPILALLATSAEARPSPLVVPRVAAAIHCDGELDEVAWHTPARTGAFVDAHGAEAAPYSDARFLRDDTYLYLALYAADEDIRSTDEFVVDLSSPRGHQTLHFTAGGKLIPALPGATLAIDTDGVIDDASADDEEWVVEAAIPLSSVPFGRDGSIRVGISRCDVTRDHVKRCGAWQGALARR